MTYKRSYFLYICNRFYKNWHKDSYITQFSLKNTTTGTKSVQIWIVSIDITYGGTGSVTPGEDTVAPVISGTKDITYVISSTVLNYLSGVSALDAVEVVVQITVTDGEEVVDQKHWYITSNLQVIYNMDILTLLKHLY